MSPKLKQIKSLPDFARFISTLRTTGGGWLVVGPEAFQGDSARVVTVEDLAEKARELLTAYDLRFGNWR